MNIGIVAACLPTIKPLFISFFDAARAITSGRTGRTQDRSGYLEHHEPSGHSLDNLSGSKGPYSAHIISVHKPRKQNRTHEGSDSDDAPLHGWQKTSEDVRGRSIIKTSEVHVS
jgi:hypothetical protein